MANQETISLLLEVKSKVDELNKTIAGFKQVGQVGTEATNQVNAAQQEQIATIAKLEKELEELKELLKKASDPTGIKNLGDAIEETGKTTEDTGSKIAKIVSFLGDLSNASQGAKDLLLSIKDLGVAAFEAVKGVAADDVALNNLAQTSGATKGAIAAIQNELVKIGESADSAGGALAQFSGFLADALGDRGGTAAEQAELLGINLDKLANSGNQVDDALKQLGTSLNPLTLSLEQSKAAATALGEDDFSKLVPALENLDQKIQTVQSRGQILTEEQSQEAQKIFQTLGDVSGSLEGLTKQLLAELLPATNRILELTREGINSLSQDSIEGLKAGITEIGRALEAIAPIIIGTSKFLVNFAGDFGTAISAILNPLETLNFLLTGNSEVAEKAGISSKKLGDSYKEASFAADQLAAKIQKLTQEQDVQSKSAEVNAEKQKLFIERLLRAGTISEEEAAQRRAKIDSDLLEVKTNNAFLALNLVKEAVAEEGRNREDALNKFANQEIDFNSRKEKALKDLEKARIESNERIFQAEKSIASEIDRLGAPSAIANLEALKIKERQLVEDKRKLVEDLSNLEKGATNNRIKAEQEVFDFKAATNLKEVVNEQALNKDLLSLRQQLSDARTNFDKADLSQRQQSLQAEKDLEQGILDDKLDAIEKINASETSAIAEQKQLLQSKARSAQEVEDQITKINIVAQQDRLTAAQTALDTFTAKNIQNAELRKQLETDIANEQIKLSDLKTKQTIDNINREISTLKSTIEVTQDINLKAIEKIELEQKTLELLKAQGATKEQLLAQENKITIAIQGAINARKEQDAKDKKALDDKVEGLKKVKSGEEAINDRIEKAAGTTEGFIERNKELGNIITQIAAKFQFAFDPKNFNETNIDVGKEKLKEFQQILAETQQDLLTGSGALNSLLLFQKELAEQAINDITNKLSEASSRLAAENAKKQAEAQAEAARQTNEQLKEIAQDRIEAIADAQEAAAEKEKQRLEDIAEENKNFNEEELKDKEKLEEDKAKVREDFAKQEKEAREREIEEEKERQRELAEFKEDSARNNADKLNKILRDGLVERATLEAQINAETDPKKKAELQAKLTEAEAKGREKETKEKEKQAELDKLLGENLSEEELKIKQEAIEKKFQLDQDAQEQREALIKSGNTKALAEFDRLIAEQKKRDEERLAAELQRIKDAAKRKEDQAAAERQKRLDDYNQRLADLQSAFDKEREEAQKAHDERLQDLKDQQQEIKDEYKKTFTEINQQAIDSAKQIGATGQAIADAFALGNKELEKYISNLNKASEAQGNINPGGNASGSSSSGSSSSSSGSGIGNSGGSSNSSGGSSSSGNSSDSGSGSSTSGSSSNSGSSGQSSSSSSSSGSSGSGKNEKKKERAEAIDSLPKTAKSSSEYKSNANKIFDAHAAFIKDRKRNYSIFVKYFEAFRSLTVDYFKQNEVFVDPKNANSFGLPFGILDLAAKPLEFADQKEAKGGFNKVVDSVIAFVENSKKDTSKGTDKAGDIGTKGGSIITPGLSSDSSSGGTKGDVADTGNQSGSQAPPPPAADPKDPALLARERENFSEIEEKNAETGAGLSGPNFPTGQQPNNPSAASLPPAPTIQQMTVQNKIEIKMPAGGNALSNAQDARKQMAKDTAQGILQDDALLQQLFTAFKQIEANEFSRTAPDLAFNG